MSRTALPVPRRTAGTGTPAAGTVHVWQVPLRGPGAAAPAALTALLSADERLRLDAYTSPAARARFLRSRAALRCVLGECLGLPPAALRFGYGPWGKPDIAEPPCALRFSVSHSGDLALLAVTGGRAVGVDVEHRSRNRPAGRLARRYFPPDEADLLAAVPVDRRMGEFCRLWTRKEACVKAAGGRLVQGLRLPCAVRGPWAEVSDPSGTLPGPWMVHDLAVPDGYSAAVALAGTAPYRVVRAWWPPR